MLWTLTLNYFIYTLLQELWLQQLNITGKCVIDKILLYLQHTSVNVILTKSSQSFGKKNLVLNLLFIFLRGLNSENIFIQFKLNIYRKTYDIVFTLSAPQKTVHMAY